MDLQDQLRNFFPDHKFSEKTSSIEKKAAISHTQINPLVCKYEKRNGRPTTIIQGFEKIKKELISKKKENLDNLKVWEIENQHLIHGFAWISTHSHGFA